MDQRQIEALTRTRPVRVAYLVELAEASHFVLDAVFETCFSYWGGRFSLIVPYRDGEALAGYREWLQTFDPDLIYSYVELDDAQQLDFHEAIYPSFLQHHDIAENEELSARSFRPRLEIDPLDVATLVPLAAHPSRFLERGLKIVDLERRSLNDRFLADSFGKAPVPLRNVLHTVLADYGNMLIVTEGEDPKDIDQLVHSPEEHIPNAPALLTEMAAHKRAVGVSHLSAMHAPRLDLRAHRWADTFNIVVGDTVEDRLLYWNARARMSPWRDGDSVDLCVPRARFEEPIFVDSLRDYLGRRNFVSGDSSQGSPRATLRSTSLPSDELELLVSRMREKRSWITYHHEVVAGLSECVPDNSIRERASFINSNAGFRAPSQWAQHHGSDDQLRLKPSQPSHLRFAPVSLVGTSSGTWAVDVDVERSINHSPFSNVEHRWRLPRRLRTTAAFVRQYQIDSPHGQLMFPRVSAGGLLTLFANAGSTLPPIKMPTDSDAIISALTQGHDWLPFHGFGDQALPSQLCFDARRSNAGRYFWGVYQLFGGLNAASDFLLHEFWRDQLAALGATDQGTPARLDRIRTRLSRRITQKLDPANQVQLDRLANLVRQEADEERATVTSLSWIALEENFRRVQDRHWVEHPARDGTDEAEWRGYQRQTLVGSVQALCQHDVLHQGIEHQCPKCLHRSWVGITHLDRLVVCEVCGDEQSAPVDRPWAFRVNSFLREALQRHGVGPLFWVLRRLQRRAQTSFWFEGPLDIFFDEASATARRPTTDIDLTMIDGGVVRMCEVKQSARHLSDPVGVATTMMRLRPDIAMLAVMEKPSAALRQKFEAFETALAGSNIKVETLTFDPANDVASEPYL